MKLTTLLLIIAIVAGCSIKDESSVTNENGVTVEIPDHLKDIENLTSRPPGQLPTHSIHLERKTEYGEMYSVLMPMFVGPKTAVDKSGRVFIADVPNNVIRAYEEDGTFISNVGRSGRGPGELSAIGTVKTNSDYLYVYDASQRLIHFYSLDTLTHDHSLMIDPTSWNTIATISSPREFEIRDDGSVIMGFSVNDDREGRYIAYYRFDSELNMESELLIEQQLPDSYTFMTSNGMSGFVQLPSTRKDLLDFARDGSIITAWTEEFVIRTYTPEGDLQSVFYSPYENSDLDPQDIIDIWGDHVKDADFPDTWPVLDNLIMDDEERIWAQTIIDDGEYLDWWVLDQNLELLAKFRWPADKQVMHIMNGNLYTKESDEDEISHIVRYEIRLTPYSGMPVNQP